MHQSTLRIRRALWRSAITAVACIAAFFPAPASIAQGTVVGTYGDWLMECDTPAGAQYEQCALTQTVQAEDRDNIGLVVIVLKTADQQAQLMRIIAPLGVLLPPPFELGLAIDGENIGKIPFVRCVTEGCVAEALLEPDLLSQLRAGATATFSIFVTPEEGIGIPVSLVGFGEGFDALP
jgi:invasion protein IalB